MTYFLEVWTEAQGAVDIDFGGDPDHEFFKEFFTIGMNTYKVCGSVIRASVYFGVPMTELVA